ncbi:MAG: prepilin peptidase, partial [Planctomycetota bacterium]|nr:prepilin peptidase [Planctomycetota bacterium]
DRISFPGAGIGLIYSALAPDDICKFFHHTGILGVLRLSPGHVGGLVLAVLGALIAYGALELFRRVFGRIAGLEVMGMGDSKLLGMMGAFLGPQMVLFSLMPGLLCGLVIGVV